MIDDSPAKLFDAANYQEINAARWDVIEDVIRSLRHQGMTLASAYDFGAGPGWFAERLSQQSLDVVALEGRPEVAAIGRKRAPGCAFEVFDLDVMASDQLPAPRDFSLSFGILYHLENPLRALRIMAAMTGKAMLLETMIVPGDIALARVVRENPNETQGILPLAMILSRPAIEQAMWGNGLTHVMERTLPVDHIDFHDLPDRHARRSMWLLTREAVSVDGFEPLDIKEPLRADYWQK
jgi:SAM-dependent methyltransferase